MGAGVKALTVVVASAKVQRSAWRGAMVDSGKNAILLLVLYCDRY